MKLKAWVVIQRQVHGRVKLYAIEPYGRNSSTLEDSAGAKRLADWQTGQILGARTVKADIILDEKKGRP